MPANSKDYVSPRERTKSANLAVPGTVSDDWRIFCLITVPVSFLWRIFFSITKTLHAAVISVVFGKQTSDRVELSFFEKRICLPLIRLLSVPGHIGFIMDGNRRYARQQNEPTMIGHRMGYDRLRRVLLWCYELGMEEISVYAFSMDNFSRSQEEVDYLMELAESKLLDLCVDGGFIMRNEIRVRICGEKSLLRPSLLEVIERVETKTAHHTRGVFNVLFAYSSKHELGKAIEQCVYTKGNKRTDWDDIVSNLYVSRPVDLIVRTSGETRLSDFLIWQIKPDETVIVFDKHYWPDYSIVDFMMGLLRYNFRIRS
jgi:ditrans,polycis-polyprenyl diphosphate synthase